MYSKIQKFDQKKEHLNFKDKLYSFHLNEVFRSMADKGKAFSRTYYVKSRKCTQVNYDERLDQRIYEILM